MEKIVKFVNEMYDDRVKHLSVSTRWWLLPFSLFWFMVQLCFFTGLCGIICSGGGVIFLLISLFDEEISMRFALFTIFMPVLAPFIWLIKYFAHGEYGILFESN